MTMPERVFIRKMHGGAGQETLLVSWMPQAGHECYVKESRLLAAEARVREVEAERDDYKHRLGVLSLSQVGLNEERATLRAALAGEAP